jgi:hypothetical protein
VSTKIHQCVDGYFEDRDEIGDAFEDNLTIGEAISRMTAMITDQVLDEIEPKSEVAFDAVKLATKQAILSKISSLIDAQLSTYTFSRYSA